MAIPDFQSMMLPMLRLAQGRAEHTMKEIRAALAQFFELTPKELATKLPSGRQGTFNNRVAWAKVHLTMAGLLKSPRHGLLQITSLGEAVLDNPPERVTIKFLQQFPAYQQARKIKQSLQVTTSDLCPDKEAETPEEILETAYEQLRNKVASSLLQHIQNNSWEFFEQLVLKLLLAMGYGGSVRDAGQATRKTGDEGIDGVIKQDRLGLDSIYLQAKRWENVVGRPEIQKFVGALHGQRAKKGVFITTSRFSTDAQEYAQQIEPKIVLIDGATLVELMMDYNLGVSSVATYTIHRVDTDFFIEEY